MEYLKILNGKCENIVDNPAIIFNFECDDFQKHSFFAINNEENVLVTAHTGSGKTVVAEYAIAHFLKKGKRIIYTSPIKALSNQKYKELYQKFEIDFANQNSLEISVGLMTGDNKMKPDADCIIMTTEILRNSLYDIGDKDKRKEIFFEDNFIDSIGCVIFDEVHYINDVDRGKVWEETINLLPKNIVLVMLSATIDKPEEFAKWIGSIKQKPINLIQTNHRVVPLEHYIFTNDKLYKIQDHKDNFLEKNFDECSKDFKESEATNKKNKSNTHIINTIASFLQKNNLLQTIFFSFSRNNCELYSKMINISLVDHEERIEIEKIFYHYMKNYEKTYLHVNQYNIIKELIMKGIAFHHSGLLPVLKEIIEIIFQKGYIKILFATETFAVGVNMPTRTIVFTELEKFTNSGRRMLYTSEYKQMAGRAGRRGMDKYGTVIILPLYDFPSKQELKSIMLGKLPMVESKFFINYSFILKIVQSNSKNMELFIRESLFQLDNDYYKKSYQYELDELNKIYEEQQSLFSSNKIKEIEELFKFEENVKQMEETGIKLTNKQIKERKRLNQKLSNNKSLQNLYNQYLQFRDLQQQINNIQYQISYIDNYVEEETNKIIKFLNYFNYLNECLIINDDSKNKITLKGIIASQINECNCLILTELITNNLFDDLTAQEIVAVLAIFIDDVKPEDRIFLKDVKCSKNVVTIINKILKIIENFKETEKSLYINQYEQNFWDIYYDYVDVAYDWADGKDIHDIIKDTNIYEGNFIRNMLKINNIAHDLACLSHIYGNLKIIPELETIEDKIIRDIVTINSLYIIN